MKPLTLALAGLEQEDITDFRRIFGKLRSQLDADWRLVDDADADLNVIDIDSIYGHMDWLKLTASGMRTAVYTSAQYAKESDLVLFKPLKADNLADILSAVAAEHAGGDAAPEMVDAKPEASDTVVDGQESLQAEAEHAEAEKAQPEPVVETPAAVPVAAPAPREVGATKKQQIAAPPQQPTKEVVVDSEPNEPVSEQPETIAVWLLSGSDKRPVQITVSDDVWIIDPDRDAYFGPATLKPLSDVLGKSPETLHDVGSIELEKARKGPAQPLARLRWYAGLKSNPGKLNPGLQASESFKLARWPQIEREFPRHFRIATAMMKQAGSVAELSRASGAPEPDVVDFINASHAIGIVEYSGGSKAAAAPSSSGVMSRLRSSLGR